ncbi:PHB depolymerase family esterase [Actinocrinis puniceicyclus]|uniref:PHB depolymerase family esterase n=2 Tax=Actinocrinis puniceicyclus TaxID=977794 RepID=A0A8J7WI29_9ACTN|nr:PHB depolymerase family esterase [Actinocrinis puniceicyclus]
MYEYVPSSTRPGAPLVVALHGCTQQASDYYDDSGWPKYADLWGFDLVFPQQPSTNDATECFDWYTSSEDTRGHGEAESIMQMVQYMQAHYSIDASRIYVTGLSAGGAMTADLLADYPDVFAAGSVDSGIPAQCAAGGQSTAYPCMDGPVSKSVSQWAALATGSDPGYSGPWPRVAIWQGTADYTVNTANSTELMDQWTGVWGISQTASSTASLPGGTSESIYDDATGEPAVEVYAISGMGHGLAVNPGSGTNQCGATGAYFLNYICSTYYTAVFWGLSGSGSSPSATATATATGTATPSASPSASPSSSPSPTFAPQCFTESNYQQTVDGHAYQSGGYTYADGSNQNMGLWNVFTVHALEETGPGYYVIADSHCP